MLISSWETLIVAILVLFVGRYLNTHIAFFRHFNIPEPVTGGFLASLVFTALFIFTPDTHCQPATLQQPAPAKSGGW